MTTVTTHSSDLTLQIALLRRNAEIACAVMAVTMREHAEDFSQESCLGMETMVVTASIQEAPIAVCMQEKLFRDMRCEHVNRAYARPPNTVTRSTASRCLLYFSLLALLELVTRFLTGVGQGHWVANVGQRLSLTFAASLSVWRSVDLNHRQHPPNSIARSSSVRHLVRPVPWHHEQALRVPE